MYAIRNIQTGTLLRDGMHIKNFPTYIHAEYEISCIKNRGVDVKNYYILKLKGVKSL